MGILQSGRRDLRSKRKSGTVVDQDRIEVNLPGGQRYPILIAAGSLQKAGSLMRENGVTGEAFVLSDSNVWGLYGEKLAAALRAASCPVLDTWLIPPGEENKSLDHWRAVIDRLAALDDGSTRRVFILNLGGGVVGDLGGFAAATYRRGIPFVQVPTTLLAQVDSSVGGKTGVNHPAGKNLIGAYHQPVFVLIDPATLQSLPPREVRAGLAEVVKVGLIRDRALFRYLEENVQGILGLQGFSLRHLIRRSCQIKATIVRQDEREQKGIRTLLNFGHTVGHALEAAAGYGRYLHGEAVAIGMLCAASVSVETGMLPPAAYGRICALLQRIGLEVSAGGIKPRVLREAMKRDKKFIHARNRLVLLERIGRARVVEGVDPAVLHRSVVAHLDSSSSG